MMVSGPRPFFLSSVGATRRRLRRKSAMLRGFEHSTAGTSCDLSHATERLCTSASAKRGEARNAVTVWPHGHCGTGRLAFRGPRLPGEYRQSLSCPANVCRDHQRLTMSKSVAAKPRRRILCRTTFVCASMFCRFSFGQQLLSTEMCRQELFLRYVTLARGPQIGQRFRRSVSSAHCTHKARACSLFSGRINRLFTRLSHLVLHAPHARPSAPSQQDKRHPALSHHPHSPSPQSLFEMERPSRHTHGFVQHDGSVVAVSLQPYHSSGRAAATAVGSLVGAFAAPMQSTVLIPIVASYLVDGVCSYRPRRQAWLRRHEAVFFPEKQFRLCRNACWLAASWGAGGPRLNASQYRPCGNAPHATRSGPPSMGVAGTAASIHAMKQRHGPQLAASSAQCVKVSSPKCRRKWA